MGVKTFHLELGKVEEEAVLSFHINEKKYDLNSHSTQTLQRAVRSNKALALIPKEHLSRITHYVDVSEEDFPKNSLSRLQVTSSNPDGSLPILHHMSIHIPEHQKRIHTQKRLGNSAAHIHPKLHAFFVGENSANRLGISDLEDINVHAELILTPWDIAKGILFHHPELASNKPHTAAIVMDEHIAPEKELDPDQYNRVFNLAVSISKQGKNNWATVTDSTDKDGNSLCYEYDLGSHKSGEKVQIYSLSTETLRAAADPLAGAMRSSNNDNRLQNQTWSVSQGTTALEHDTETMAEIIRNATHAGLQKINAQEFKWTVNELTPSHGLNAYNKTISFNSGNTFSIEVKNTYLRTLCAYAQFFDDNGQIIKNPTGWQEQLPEFLRGTFETDSKKYISIVSAISTILGIPMPTDPTKLSFIFPKEASSVKLLFGGLGTSKWDNDVDLSGALLTGVFQYGIPIFFLAAGAAITNSKFFNDFIADTDNLVAALGVAFGVVGGGVATASALMNTKRVLFICADAIAGILVKYALKKLLLYITGCITVQQLETQIPYVGWALKLANIAIDISELAVTTGEILSSPATLSVEVKRAMDLRLILKPDPMHGEAGHPETAVWPAVADNYQITLQYKGGTNRVLKGKLPATTSNIPIDLTFADIPVGGELQIIAGIYSQNGWLCGKWQSDWIDAFPDSGGTIKTVTNHITEILVPLTQDTQYNYKEKIVYDAASGKHVWHAGDRPVQTLKDLDSSGIGNHLCKLVDITINNQAFQVGYTWRASGEGLPPVGGSGGGGLEYLCQNISVLADPQSRFKSSEVGFNLQPYIAYDQISTQSEGNTDVSENNFILDTRKGEFHLRQVNLMDGKSGFGLDDPNLKSWGKFNLPHLDAIVVHPDRSVVAVSWQESKMEILQLPEKPSEDKDAACAQMVSGQGIRQGLLQGPVAITVTPDGRILVLETINQRIQAFDTKGNPVPCFLGDFEFSLDASQYTSDLDKGIFSNELQEQFQSHGLTHLFDMSSFLEKDLDNEVLSDALIDVFSSNGVYLSYEKSKMDDHTISSYVTVVTKGSKWVITDPGRNYIYNVCQDLRNISVYDVLNNVTVTVRNIGKEWIVQDLSGAQSYFISRAANDFSKLSLNRYNSYVPLFNPEGRTDIRYLDMAVEAKGYVYVLSYTGSGDRESDYRLDIYQPDGKFLVRTPEQRLQPTNPEYLNVARIAIDIWRNVYSLNFEAIHGPSNRTEPSISHWVPTPPLFDLPPEKKAEFDLGDMNAIRNDFKAHNIVLSQSAAVTTINQGGYWLVTDVSVTYDVIYTTENIEVYSISAV